MAEPDRSDTNFKDRTDVPIGRTAFFRAIVTGNPVKVRGALQGSAPRWEEAELED